MRSLAIPQLMLIGTGLFAQAGTPDPSFAPMDLSGGGADGLNGGCHDIAVQLDGKILVGGGFNNVNGVARDGVARLNADGSLDLEFDPGYGANSGVRAVAVQADGKVLVGGMFTYFDAHGCNHLVRLMPDGSVDESFDMGNGFDGNVNALFVQADGKVLVGGDFFHFNGVASRGLARLNTDGSADNTFDAGDMGIVYSLLPMGDGRILVGGLFGFVGGVERRCIAAIDADGAVDLSFAPFGWNASAVFGLAVQTDGKVIAGGMIPGGIARMEANGELDPFFGSGISGFGGWDPWVYDVALQSDGRILCVGRFESYNGTVCNGMARLNADGSFDDTFAIGQGFNLEVFTMAMQSDGRTLVGGYFNQLNGTAQNHIARLFAEDLSTAVTAIDGPSLDVYPNPSNGYVFVRTDARSTATLNVTGPDGRLVRVPFTPATSGGVQSVDLSAYAKGVYLVRIAGGTTTRTERLVIQ